MCFPFGCSVNNSNRSILQLHEIINTSENNCMKKAQNLTLDKNKKKPNPNTLTCKLACLLLFLLSEFPNPASTLSRKPNQRTNQPNKQRSDLISCKIWTDVSLCLLWHQSSVSLYAIVTFIYWRGKTFDFTAGNIVIMSGNSRNLIPSLWSDKIAFSTYSFLV